MISLVFIGLTTADAQDPSGATIYDMVRVPSGEFTMGGKVGVTIERPLHTVEITRDFYIGKTEVNQQLFMEVMGYDPVEYWGDACVGITLPSHPTHPAYCISWYESVRFANALSKRDGLEQCYVFRGGSLFWPRGFDCTGYRLPSEAEWEYAAKTGADHVFSGGGDIGDYGWFWGNSNRTLHSVGKKSGTDWGVHDMSGNVWEWVWDYYGDYPRTKQIDPFGPEYSEFRVRRGGSWFSGIDEVRTGTRMRRNPRSHFSLIGFRLVRTAPAY